MNLGANEERGGDGNIYETVVSFENGRKVIRKTFKRMGDSPSNMSSSHNNNMGGSAGINMGGSAGNNMGSNQNMGFNKKSDSVYLSSGNSPMSSPHQQQNQYSQPPAQSSQFRNVQVNYGQGQQQQTVRRNY